MASAAAAPPPMAKVTAMMTATDWPVSTRTKNGKANAAWTARATTMTGPKPKRSARKPYNGHSRHAATAPTTVADRISERGRWRVAVA